MLDFMVCLFFLSQTHHKFNNSISVLAQFEYILVHTCIS